MDDHKFTRKDMCVSWGLCALVAFIFALGMTGCNTVAGLGADIQATAEGIRSEMAKD